MEKPLAVIIHPDAKTRFEIESALRTYKVPFDVREFGSYEEWKIFRLRNNRLKANLYLCNATTKHPRYVKYEDRTKGFSPDKIVIHGDAFKYTKENMVGIPIKYKRSLNERELHQALDNIFDGGFLHKRLRVGIIGLAGKLGRNILSVSLYHRYFGIITEPNIQYNVYSKSFGGDIEKYNDILLKYMKAEPAHRKPRPNETTARAYASLEDLIEDNLDVIIISTGKHIDTESLKRNKSRKEWFPHNLPSLEEVYSAIQRIKPSSFIIVETNPPGSFINMGVNQYQIDPNQISSISPGNYRFRTAIYCVIKRHLKPPYNDPSFIKQINPFRIKDIGLYCFGEHGEDFSTLRGMVISTIKDERISISDIIDSETEFMRDILKIVRKMGYEEILWANQWHEEYYSTPYALVKGLEDISIQRATTRTSWYCYHPELNAHLLWPTRLEYRNRTVKVFPDYNRLSFSDISPEELAEIKRQAEEQQSFVRNRNNPDFFKTL